MSPGFRRRGFRWGRSLPWLGALAITAVVAFGLHRAFAEDDLVGIAAVLRAGDAEAGVEPDPVAALDVLEGLLAEQPGNYEGWIESAKAWQDLRSWDNAVNALERAADCAPSLSGKAYAMNVATAFLIIANRYGEAVEMGEAIAELYPTQAIKRTYIGTIYLAESDALQRDVVQHFVDRVDKRARDIEIEAAIEAYVSDVWRTPDVDQLLDDALPGADPVLRRQIQEQLVLARERFLDANAALADYPEYDGFDAMVARAYCQVLMRTGRLYDAYLEAAIALRQPGLTQGIQRDFLDVQARGAMSVGDYAQAADRYGLLIEAFLAADELPPALIVWDLYEARVRAGQHEWILDHVEPDVRTHGDDPVLRWAQAEALAALGRRDEARNILREPFNVVALGSRTAISFSLRGWPERRRRILMLAHHLYQEIGDSRAATALDALLAQSPADKQALRLRADLAATDGRTDAAAADSFALLTRESRNPEDFQRWLDAADRVSIQRTGVELATRALLRIRQVRDQKEEETDAGIEVFRALGVRPKGRAPPVPDALFFPADPAFSFAIVQELIDQGDIERARRELRKLADSFLGVQEFRFRLGQLLVRAGLYQSAAREFELVLEARPDDIAALDMATRAYRAIGADLDAARLINRMILDDPLGVGAALYGQRLLDQGRPDEVARLVERFVRHTDYGERPDVLILAARSKLALGDLGAAQAILGPLATLHGGDLDVALLALDLGFAGGQPGVVDAAVNSIRSLAPGLPPDQMAAVTSRLRAGGRMDALVEVFDEQVAALPAAQTVLRDVAAAHKALGNLDTAAELLARCDDGESLLDHFLLLAMQGREHELDHDLRVRPVGDGAAQQVELCLLLSDVLDGSPALMDLLPGERLAALGLDRTLADHELELLDALLRILPALARMHPIVPGLAVEHPDHVWPLVGDDVRALLTLGQTDRKLARQVATDMLFMVLFGNRPFWEREALQLAEHALLHLPGLVQPRRVLARAALRAGQAESALGILQPLLVDRVPQADDLRLFLQACYEHGRSEWGVATALFLQHDAEALLVLAEAMAEWNHPAEARDLFRRVLDQLPGDARAQAGLIRALAATGDADGMSDVIDAALSEHPDDATLARACVESASRTPQPSPRVLQQLESLFAAWPAFPEPAEALARSRTGQPEEQRVPLQQLVDRIADGQVPLDVPEHAHTFVRAARIATRAGLTDLTVPLCEAALLVDPGSLTAIRELASLDLAEGRPDAARRRLEVLSFVDPGDRDPGMTLARLYFQQLGQPARAADIVRRTYSGTKPIEATEILAAEAYLAGLPDEALLLFQAVARSPGITPDTYLTVARIAYASGKDDVARALYDRVLEQLGPNDPRRARAQWLRTTRLAQPVPPQPSQARVSPSVEVPPAPAAPGP
jgi:tetratricopeptide (TPR) repeat protein